MILEHKIVELLNKVVDKLDNIDYNNIDSAKDKVADAKDDLVTFRDETQNEIDEFEKWADQKSDEIIDPEAGPYGIDTKKLSN
tara:strand:- start:773 stop:1021 length:249 start_codon:yes stop_codon:yes gene_type:complete